MMCEKTIKSENHLFQKALSFFIKDKIYKVLDIISGNGDFFGKYIAIEKILQQGGVAKLMYLLYKKGKENNDEWIVNEFLSPIEKIQSLFLDGTYIMCQGA